MGSGQIDVAVGLDWSVSGLLPLQSHRLGGRHQDLTRTQREQVTANALGRSSWAPRVRVRRGALLQPAGKDTRPRSAPTLEHIPVGSVGSRRVPTEPPLAHRDVLYACRGR